MRFRSTIIAFAAVVALGLYSFYGEHKGDKKHSHEEELAHKIFDFDKKTITSVDVQLGNYEKKEKKVSYRLEKKDENWFVIGPGNFRADLNRVNSLLGTFERAGKKEVFPVDEKTPFKNYGLEPPELTVTLKSTEGKEYKVSYGWEVPTQSTMYVRINTDNEVVITPKNMRNAVDKEISQIRESKVVPDFDHSAVNEVVAWGPAVPRFVAKKHNGRFRFEHPFQVPIHLTEWDKWYGQFKTMRSKDFSYDGAMTAAVKRKYGLNKPALEVKFNDKEGKLLHHIAFGRVLENPKKPGKYELYAHLVGSTTVGKFGHGQWDKYFKRAGDLMLDKPVSFARGELKKIRISKGDSAFELLKDEKNSWTLVNAKNEKKPAENNKVESLVNQALSFKVENGNWRKKSAQAGLQKPLWKVEFLAQDKDLLSLSAGNKQGNNRYLGVSTYPDATILASLDFINKFKLEENEFKLKPKPTPAPKASKPKKEEKK